MDFLELASRIQSTRKYDINRPIESEQIERIKELLNIPYSKRGILDILIGYPAQELRPEKRKSTDEIVS